MSKKDVTLGIIGAGRIGQMHAGILSRQVEGVKVKVVCDVVKEAARQCAATEGIERYCDDPGLVFDDPDVEAVVVCSSTDTHARMISMAARAGKHVFCEKPISFDIDEIKATLKSVEEAGVKLQVGFNRRFDPSFARVRQAVVDGQVGDVHLVRVTSRDPEPPPVEYIKKSGGLFYDMTIHDFDMVRFLSGCEVEEVFANGAVLVDRKIGQAGDIDSAAINLVFKNGALGFIENSRRAVYGYDQRVEVFGSQGMVSADNARINTVTISTDQSIGGDLLPLFFLERYTSSYIRETQSFVDAVRNDTPPLVSGNDGLEPVYMARACALSLKEGRSVKIGEIK